MHPLVRDFEAVKGEAVEIRFEVADAGAERELRSLRAWLAGDRALRGTVDVTPVQGAQPGRMSPALEAVSAVLSSGAALGELARSYLAWRHRDRRTAPPVTVVVIAPDAERARAEAVLRDLGILAGAAPPDGGQEPAPQEDAEGGAR